METVTFYLIAVVIIGIVLAIIGGLSDKNWIFAIGLMLSLLGGVSLAAFALCSNILKLQ